MIPVTTITAEIPDVNGKYRTFHFRNEKKKDTFIRTLYSHRLSDIEFSVLIEEIQPTRDLLMELDKDPIVYACDSIGWARETLSLYNKMHLTDDELAYIKSVC